MKEPGAVDWTEGKGVFVNNYDNFAVWVNMADQLRLVSTALGQDIKYVLLRLQKAAVKIEEAIKVENTSLAAKGALAHRLQRRTACKIQNGRQGAPKWRTGSGKVSTPRFLGILRNFRKISFLIRALLL